MIAYFSIILLAIIIIIISIEVNTRKKKFIKEAKTAQKKVLSDPKIASLKNDLSDLKKQQDLNEKEKAEKAAYIKAIEKAKAEGERLKKERLSKYESPLREPISGHIRDQVWRRDEGQCVKCGSKEDLEYDHIKPVSRGGKSTYRNLQLLCQSCNRSKGSNY